LAPDHARTALVILDMISDFRFPDGAEVLRAARRIAPHIAALKRRAHEAGLAVIYVNDYSGRWRSDRAELLQRALASQAKGQDVVHALLPEQDDYFILKPRHSAFYATPLDILLTHLGTKGLILSGISSHQCVLFTANDAHVRGLDLIIPTDCVGAPTGGESRFAIQYFKSVLGAQITTSRNLKLRGLR
jgi:nicotinamidase-related amidase